VVPSDAFVAARRVWQTEKIPDAKEAVNPKPLRIAQGALCMTSLAPEKESQRQCGAARMGGTRLELVTSTMSTWRSNQLS
jgi:hypothetical protein